MSPKKAEKKIKDIIVEFARPLFKKNEEFRIDITEVISKHGKDINGLRFRSTALSFDKTDKTDRIEVNIYRETNKIAFFFCPNELFKKIEDYILNNVTGFTVLDLRIESILDKPK